MTEAQPYLLEARHIVKVFGDLKANDDVSLQIAAGEIHALLGENGAGKSTLVKILTGIHQPDTGQIYLDGAPIKIRSPADAQKQGICVIHQESVVFDDVSVAENIFVTVRPRRYERAARTVAGAIVDPSARAWPPAQ